MSQEKPTPRDSQPNDLRSELKAEQKKEVLQVEEEVKKRLDELKSKVAKNQGAMQALEVQQRLLQGNRERPAGFAKLPKETEDQRIGRVLEQFSAAEKRKILESLTSMETVPKQVQLRMEQLAFLRTIFDETLAQSEKGQAKTRAGKGLEWGKRLGIPKVYHALGLSSNSDLLDKLRADIQAFYKDEYPKIEREILRGNTTMEQIIAKNPLMQRAVKKYSLKLPDPRDEKDLVLQHNQLLSYLRGMKAYDGAAALVEHVLSDEFAAVEKTIPKERKAEIKYEAAVSNAELVKRHRTGWKNPSKEMLELGARPMTDEEIAEKSLVLQKEKERVLLNAEIAKNFDPSVLTIGKRKLWQQYNDMLDPKGEIDNLSDVHFDMIIDEVAINAPLIIGSGGIASLARAGVTAGARSMAGRLFVKTALQEGAKLTTRQVIGAGAKKTAAWAAGTLVEGVAFEAVHSALLGEMPKNLPEWVERSLWSSATLGLFHGAGKIGERVTQTAILKKCFGKITSEPARKAAELLLVKGHIEAAAMLVMGAAQNGATNGSLDEFYENFGEELLHSYVTVGALKVGHASVETVTGKIFKPAGGTEKIEVLEKEKARESAVQKLDESREERRKTQDAKTEEVAKPKYEEGAARPTDSSQEPILPPDFWETPGPQPIGGTESVRRAEKPVAAIDAAQTLIDESAGRVCTHVDKGEWEKALAIKQEQHLPDQIFQDSVRDGMTSGIGMGYLDGHQCREIQQKLGVSIPLDTPVIREMVFLNASVFIRDGNLQKAKFLCDSFGMQEKDIQQVAGRILRTGLVAQKDRMPLIKSIFDEFKFTDRMKIEWIQEQCSGKDSELTRIILNEIFPQSGLRFNVEQTTQILPVEFYREFVRRGDLQTLQEIWRIFDCSTMNTDPGVRHSAFNGITELLSSVQASTKKQVIDRDDGDDIFEKIHQDSIDSSLKKSFKEVQSFQKDFGISDHDIRSEVMQALIGSLREGLPEYAIQLRNAFTIEATFFQDPVVKEVILVGTAKLLRGNNYAAPYQAKKLCELTEFTDTEMQPILEQALKFQIEKFYSYKNRNVFNNMKMHFNISDALVAPDVQVASCRHIRGLFCDGNFEGAREDKVALRIDDTSFNTAAREAVVRRYQVPELYTKLRDELHLPEELDAYDDVMMADQQGLAETWDLKTFKDLREFSEKNSEFTTYLRDNESDGKSRLIKDDIPAIQTLKLTLVEVETLKRGEEKTGNPVNLSEIVISKNYDALLDLLRKNCEGWNDDQNVALPYLHGCEVFGEGDRRKGHENMLKYLDRSGLSRHDGLHAFERVIALHQASGLSPAQFYRNILSQVRTDDARYNSGTAHHHLNAIALSLNTDFSEVLAKAKGFDGLERLQELVGSLQDPTQIFSSWKSLQRYQELATTLERVEGLQQLSGLRKAGKDKLCDFAETLAFHSDSKVSIQEVMTFVSKPDNFLGQNDSHTPTEVHNRKKPSNYTEIPNLDLDAPQLRDAFVEGPLDQLQSIRPMEIRYSIPKSGETYPSVQAAMKAALGSRQANIQGKAQQVPKLFGACNAELKKYGLTVQAYLEGAEVPEAAKSVLEKKLWSLVFDPSMGIKQNGTITVIAKINLKSDPVGVLAGNDTACCMPFGSGKNNVYMFNPNTAMFTLQLETADGHRRTIAQSLLTRDKDIKSNIADLIPKMQQSNTHLGDVISADVLQDAPSYIAADNVEVAINYKDGEWPKLIENVYADFFHEYMQRFAKEQGVTPDSVPVGMGYSKALRDLPTMPNTFAPEAPIGYSDKTHSNVFKLTPGNRIAAPQKEILVTPKPQREQPSAPDITGIQYLDFTDTLPVAYLEGKAYSDNQSLIVNLHNIENGLIAKDINNTAKDRPNMSFKYTDDTGKMRGYLFAYEGICKEAWVGVKEFAGKPVLYIADLASERTSARAGGSLIKAFVTQYKTQYLEKGKAMPILIQARESTSYRIIQKQLAAIGKEMGIEFKMQEFPTYTEGGETMHPLLIQPVLKNVDGSNVAPPAEKLQENQPVQEVRLRREDIF